MTQTAASLTQTDVARLMGLLTHAQVRDVILAIGRLVSQNSLAWVQHRGRPDDFGPSLYRQARNGGSLTTNQVNAAKAMLLQRNWAGVVEVLTRDLARVPDSVIVQARSSTAPAPTYQRRTRRRNSSNRRSTPSRARRRRSAPQQPVAAPAPQPAQTAPQAAPQPRPCGALNWGVRCVLPRGHSGAHVGEGRQSPMPTNDADTALAALRAGSTSTAVPARSVQTEPLEDARAARFALVIEAAWDEVAPAPVAEVDPEDDPGVQRFRLLDLD